MQRPTEKPHFKLQCTQSCMYSLFPSLSVLYTTYHTVSICTATTPCKKWPLLANYNITSKEFTCSGAISAFRLCSFHAYTHIGLTVWRRGKGTLGRRVEYANGGFDILHRDLTYERGDQLDYMVSYYYAENHNEGIG